MHIVYLHSIKEENKMKEGNKMNKMLIKTITDKQEGRKWEIYKKSDNEYFYKYYEFFKQTGWRLTCREGDNINGYLTKDVVEWEFDIKL